jgi:enoyl-CoA hydratase/carnithine racemase
MTTSLVNTRREGSALLVELNNPDRLNAFGAAMFAELEQIWKEAASDPNLRAIILTGAGRGFCAGADVGGTLSRERKPRGPSVDEELSFLPGDHVAVPVIVAVNGVCAGGGLHFVADGDIVIASESASFLDPHVSVGQVTGIEPVSLSLRVATPHLMRLAVLGRSERLSAQQALAIGLVSEVVAPGELLPRAFGLAEQIAANSPAAVAASRAILRQHARRQLHEAMQDGWNAVQRHWRHPDSAEGPAAFRQKRPPEWVVDQPEPGPTTT